MKKSTFNFRILFLAVGFFWITLTSYSQDVKLTRQERKAVKETAQQAGFYYLDSLLQSKQFVLMAYVLQNQYGDRVHVTPLLNFIRVNMDNIVLQTGVNPDRGYNGVGGVTAEGTMGNYSITRNLKSKSCFLQFTVLSNIGSYDVSIRVSADNQARAEITGLSYGRLIYVGRVQSIHNSGVYKGWNSI